MTPFLSVVSVLALLVLPSEGFTFNAASPNPVLHKFAQTQTGTVFSIGLDVGKDENSHMLVNGLVLELHPDPIDKGSYHPALPGANGPDPRLSTGAKKLSIKQEPYYINMSGMQHVHLKGACWELAWKDGAPAGSLVCGFHNTEEAKRNDASLPKGRIYISFPVWTKESLADAQERKRDVETRARQYIQDKDDELAKMQTTNNPIMKALHYRNAAAALEKYWICGVDSLKMIPSDTDTLALQDSLMLTTKGTVWTKKEGFFGGHHALLGTATISPLLQNDNDKLKP
jgi:hypothetical protein